MNAGKGVEIRALLGELAAAKKEYYLSLFRIAESYEIPCATVALIAGANTEQMRSVWYEKRGKAPRYADFS